MWSFHTPTQKIHPLLKIHPQNPKFSPKSSNPQFPLIFQRKLHLTKIFPTYRTPYRQSPYFTTLFRPLSHKIQLKIFTNSLFHPNFLPYLKAFLRCTIFTSKIIIQLIFFKHKISNLQTENNNISNKTKNKKTRRHKKLCA